MPRSRNEMTLDKKQHPRKHKKGKRCRKIRYRSLDWKRRCSMARCDYRGELIDLSITHLFREFPFLIKRHSAVWAENWQLARDGRTIKLLLFLLLLFLSGFFLLSHFLSFLLLLCSCHSTDLSAQLPGSFAPGVHQFTGDSGKRCLTLQPPCLTRRLSEDWVWLRRIIK